MAGQDEYESGIPEPDGQDDCNADSFLLPEGPEPETGRGQVIDSDPEDLLDDLEDELSNQESYRNMGEPEFDELAKWITRQSSPSSGRSDGQQRRRPKSKEPSSAPEFSRSPNKGRRLADRPIPINGPQTAGAGKLTVEKDLMEALVEAAEHSPTRARACHLAAAMVPLAAQSTARHLATILPVLPVLIEGTAGLTGVIYDQPASRPFVRLIPAILERTFGHLARLAAQDEPITPEASADILAEYTGAIIMKHYRSAKRGKFSGSAGWDNGYDT